VLLLLLYITDITSSVIRWHRSMWNCVSSVCHSGPWPPALL